MSPWQLLMSLFGFIQPFISQFFNQPTLDQANQQQQETIGQATQPLYDFDPMQFFQSFGFGFPDGSTNPFNVFGQATYQGQPIFGQDFMGGGATVGGPTYADTIQGGDLTIGGASELAGRDLSTADLDRFLSGDEEFWNQQTGELLIGGDNALTAESQAVVGDIFGARRDVTSAIVSGLPINALIDAVSGSEFLQGLPPSRKNQLNAQLGDLHQTFARGGMGAQELESAVGRLFQPLMEEYVPTDLATIFGDVINRQRSGDVFREAAGEFPGFDFPDVDLSDALGRLEGGMLAPGTLWGQVDFPEIDFEAQRRARLGELGQATEVQQQMATEQAISQGFAEGRGLQEISGSTLPALQRQISGAAGQIGAGIESSTEQLRLQQGLTRAGMQAGLSTTEQQINNALRLAGAGLQGQGAFTDVANAIMEQTSTEDAVFRRAMAEAGFQLPESTLDFNTASQIISSMMGFGNLGLNQIGTLGNLALGASGQSLQALLGAAPITAGYSPFYQLPGQALQGGYQNVMSLLPLMLMGSNDPKGGYNAGLSIFGTGGSFGQSCVDGRSLILTYNGPRMLSEIAEGDVVMAADGEWKRVAAKDYGTVPEEGRTQDHAMLVTETGEQIVATLDHSIGGKPMGDWKAGDVITMVNGDEQEVIYILEYPYVVSGDLGLEDGSDYVANGFRVRSNLTPIIAEVGLEKWREHVTPIGTARRS